METTTIINKKSVVWNLEEMTTGVLVKAELISKGFEGSDDKNIEITSSFKP